MYTDKTFNESVCTYTENMSNAQKGKYLGKLETKIENILGGLSEVRWVPGQTSIY
jgi:hypothetical protein